MHLIAAIPGGWSPDQDGVTHVVQTPGDIIFLSASDTELATMAAAYHSLTATHSSLPSLRIANLGYFKQELTVDTYIEEVTSQARLIVVRALGGRGYFTYLIEQLQATAAANDIPVIFLSGHGAPEHELMELSTVEPSFPLLLWPYFQTLQAANATGILQLLCNRFFSYAFEVAPPFVAADVFLYHPDHGLLTMDDAISQQAQVVLISYRAHFLADNLAPVRTLIDLWVGKGIPAVVLFVQSLRERYLVNELQQYLLTLGGYACQVIVNTTGFSIRQFDQTDTDDFIYSRVNMPVIQAIHASVTQAAWAEGTFGLSPTDIAMHVALPELDGRIISRPISFKQALEKDTALDSDLLQYASFLPGCQFVVDFSERLIRLRTTPARDKKVALILPNYPNKDSRLANGVGLDTPQSTVRILHALRDAGYTTGAPLPVDSAALMEQVTAYVTNEPGSLEERPHEICLSKEDFYHYYRTLSPTIREKMESQWGRPEDDPYFNGTAFTLPGFVTGHVFVSIQPSRGYHIDIQQTYHSPDLPPTYSYLAFYCWVQYVFKADAVVHVGKHGNLEWLPGKSLALDAATCFPAAVFGAIPHFYPFIINDPGEGTQAKRRTQAVVIDHLIPPMTRAETYGVLLQLENLIDEYYEAFYADTKRARLLRKDIEALVIAHHLETDLGIASDDIDALLVKLDGYLCEIKEAQIRDGLHIFGETPVGDQLIDLLIALHRLPSGELPGITQALGADVGLPFDPLDTDYATPYGDDVLATKCRTHGDVIEILEQHVRQHLSDALAAAAAAGPGYVVQLADYPQLSQVLTYILMYTVSKVHAGDEIRHLLKGLSGGYVPAGGSGAPTRGRVDILPTGRNFYSIDVRTVPTEAAYRLGTKSAEALIARYVQEHGDYPTQVALSVWGTSTMRTGGDDIAQAMALMGVRPRWQSANRRVYDFEVVPLFQLGRPRIDVMLRVSGFFRDAFPDIIALFNAIVEKVSMLDEPVTENFVKQRMEEDQAHWIREGYATAQAQQMAQYRVFGAKPGAYGAGLQALIDEQAWQTREDLAAAYREWSSYAYDKKARGVSAPKAFKQQLGHVSIVLQNQDNREHDILDSDDYYQFQGGLANAVTSEQGKAPSIYFGDHARPDNPRIKTLKEELLKVFRSRVVNPKWLAGVKRHGYKGAFEMAATLDYLFAYDATTNLVDDFMYEGITQAYLFDEGNRQFIEQANPWALRDMSERLLEAIQRGMWQAPDAETVRRLEEMYVEAE